MDMSKWDERLDRLSIGEEDDDLNSDDNDKGDDDDSDDWDNDDFDDSKD